MFACMCPRSKYGKINSKTHKDDKVREKVGRACLCIIIFLWKGWEANKAN